MKNILCFGFHYNETRISPHSGLKEDKKIFDKIYNSSNANFYLFTRGWASYQTSDKLKVYDFSETFKNTGKYAKSLSKKDLGKFSQVEMVSLEMFMRFRFRQTESNSVATDDARWLSYRQQAVRAKLAYWSNYIEEQKIDFYFSSNVPHLVDDYIAYEICRFKGIPAHFTYRLPIVPGVFSRLYIPADLENHRVVFTSNGEWYDIGDLYRQALEEPAELPSDIAALFEQSTLNGKTLGEIAISGSKPPWAETKATPRKKGAAITPLRKALRWGHFVGQLIKPSTRERALDAFSESRYIRKNQPRLSEKVQSELAHYAKSDMPSGDFLYLPLHLQPEASSCPLGGTFSNQLSFVRFIAQYLPTDWRLVVKEHPLQKLEIRPKGWYKEIADTPGVALVSREVSTDSLTNAARAVCTLTGTAALEAWLHLKPALVFGDILFDSAPGIYKIRTDEDMKKAVTALEGRALHTQVEVKSYLAALGKASFVGHLESYTNPNMNNNWLNEDKNVRQVSEQIISLIKFYLSEKSPVADHLTHHENT